VAGRLWMDACAASNGVMAMIADRLALPRAGRDGRPEAGDAVIAIRRGSGRKAGSNDGAPGVWLLDGTPGLDREDVEQMLMAGVRLDPALLAEFAGIGGSDGCAGAAGGAARCAGAADADALGDRTDALKRRRARGWTRVRERTFLLLRSVSAVPGGQICVLGHPRASDCSKCRCFICARLRCGVSVRERICCPPIGTGLTH